VRGIMGETGIRILVRIMGLLLVALAVQFFINGLTDLGLIAKSNNKPENPFPVPEANLPFVPFSTTPPLADPHPSWYSRRGR
jgi:hypothetical protein